MELSPDDYALVEEELGRPPNAAEEALFVNLWSEHCAYRSSRPALADLPTEGEHVVVPPGDDAAVIELDPTGDGDTLLALGIESHNHPSYVDPYDGAATGVGGIVRDILSMGADPIALQDCIYFGDFEREKARYLFEGVVDGISDYGNSIGVPTVGGQTYFDESYDGNPLVNVMCVGLVDRDSLLTADLKEPGNELVLVGASTGRDGMGGASFASEDLGEEAESEDRPAVQVGDPYTEKLLIDATREIREHVEAARDLGAAGLSGASSEMAAKSGYGAHVRLDDVHLREEDMQPWEILLSESQERMLYEVRPDEVDAVREITEKYDLGFSRVGEVTDSGRYKASYDGETVVDLPAEFLADGAPVHDLDREEPQEKTHPSPYDVSREGLLEALSDPNDASKEWVYRQYDHEVQTRTAVKPGDDSAVLAVDGVGVALSAGCDSRRVEAHPYRGGYETVVENVSNLAAKGARATAFVNCLNFGNPERPDIYGEFRDAVEGMADAAGDVGVPVVGGNVSLYNESEEFGSAVNPTPTVAAVGVAPDADAPRMEVSCDVGTPLVLLDASDDPSVLEEVAEDVASHAEASHDVSTGGLAVALAEMCGERGVRATVDGDELYDSSPGRVVVAGDPDEFDGGYESTVVGEVTERDLEIHVDADTLELSQEEIEEARAALEDAM